MQSFIKFPSARSVYNNKERSLSLTPSLLSHVQIAYICFPTLLDNNQETHIQQALRQDCSLVLVPFRRCALKHANHSES